MTGYSSFAEILSDIKLHKSVSIQLYNCIVVWIIVCRKFFSFSLLYLYFVACGVCYAKGFCDLRQVAILLRKIATFKSTKKLSNKIMVFRLKAVRNFELGIYFEPCFAFNSLVKIFYVFLVLKIWGRAQNEIH